MHHARPVHDIMMNILSIHFACDHEKLCWGRVIKTDKHERGPVTLLVSVGEILEVEAVCWVVLDLSNPVFVCRVLQIKQKPVRKFLILQEQR